MDYPSFYLERFMSRFKFKKIYPRDLTGPTVQRNINNTARIGMIQSVDAQAGTCTVKWLDRPGIRVDVIITQSSPGTWEIPEKGTICLVMFDLNERARIVRYINMGHESRIKKTYSLPKLESGDRMWEVGGSYLYMKKNGDIVLSTLTQGYLVLENKTGTLKSETVNWKVTTEAGIGYFGVVKRYVKYEGVENVAGDVKNELIRDANGNIYTEYVLRLTEFADGVLGVTGISEPLLELIFGTFVDSTGDVVNKIGQTASSKERQIGIRLRLSDKTDIIIDKEGRVTINTTSININNASVDNNSTWSEMIGEGIEIQNSSKGTRGEHAAREHDKVTIPMGVTFSDSEHLGLTSKNNVNLTTLDLLAKAFVSPAGPCTLNPALLPPNLSLEGEITEGALNIFMGGE